MVMLDS